MLAAGFGLVAAALPAAWLVRNSVTFGEPTMTIATSGGANLWIGNHEGASGSQKSFDVAEDIRAELDAMPADDDELRSDAVFRRENERTVRRRAMMLCGGGPRRRRER